MILETLIVSTLVGAGIVALSPDRYAGQLAALLSLLPLGGSLWLFGTYEGTDNVLLDGTTNGFESIVSGTVLIPLGDYTIRWIAAVDGLSIPLIVLTTLLTTVAIVHAWKTIQTRQAQFYSLLLVVEAALIGVFVTLDFFVWFVFWEAVLIPMYLLIGIWGGDRRSYAAIKFLIYTNIGSFVVFLGMLLLVVGLDVETFSLLEITAALHTGAIDGYLGVSASQLKLVAFVTLFVGFAIKVPVVPVHTWLPAAHVQAPAPVSILLAGALLKMGTYALVRYNLTMFPEVVVAYAEPIAILGVGSVLYGALVALAQSDLKRVVAYSSISSMGYVILGIAAVSVYGIGGATFQMLSHGLISGLLFMLVGIIYRRTHTRDMDELSGLAGSMPSVAALFVVGAFAYLGLPLLSGFAAEVFVFIGAFDAAFTAAPLITALGMFGIVIVAGYLLWALQRTVFGPTTDQYDNTTASTADLVAGLVLIGLIVLLGTVPEVAFGMIEDATTPIVDYVQSHGGGLS